MDFDKKDGFSYLDNVPVKISSKFLPPRPVAIPFAFDTKLPEDLLAEQYDFSLERKVLEFHQKHKAELEKTKTESNGKDVASEIGTVSKTNSQHIPLQPDIILQPKPQQLLDKMPDDDVKNNMKKINFSDFENDTSSPFDYMELQTINDLEELSNVFQGLNNKHQSNENTHIEDKENSLNDSTRKIEPSCNFSKSISFPLPQNVGLDCDENISNSTGGSFIQELKAKSTLSSSMDECRLSFSFPRVSGPVNDFSFVSSNDEKNCDNSCNVSALPQVPYISSHGVKGGNEENGDFVFASKSILRGCKSYSDIYNLTDAESPSCSDQERSRTPPTTMLSSSSVTKLCHDSSTNNSDLNCANSTTKLPGLPDPYEELDENSKQIVDSITDMGFSRGQVARTVKHLGTDEKTVVEHLCQIQSFEELGYDSLEAEAALHLHDYNKDQAKTFLDLVNQFQDLGFEKSAVKKALVQNKNDWNKTIDALLP